MTSDDLRAVLDARPFRPFTLHMTDGRFLAVPTAHFMSIHPDSTLLFVWNLGDRGYSLVNVDQVVRLEFEAPAGSLAGSSG